MSYNIPQQWGMLTTYHGRAWYTNREHLPCLCLSTTFCNLRDYGMSKTKRQVNALLCKVHLHKPFVDYYGSMCRQRYNKISIKYLIGVRYLIFYWYSWFIVKRGLLLCERKGSRRFFLREAHELMGSYRRHYPLSTGYVIEHRSRKCGARTWLYVQAILSSRRLST